MGKDKSPEYCLFGAKRLMALVEDMYDFIDADIDDIEYVHDLRVTSRRIRAAMNIYSDAFSKRQHKEWKFKIRNITQSLGLARDLDVQIDFLEREFPDKEGIEYLLASHRERRAQIQPDILSTLDNLRESEVLEDMISACGKVVRKSKGISETSGLTYTRANINITQQIDSFLAMDACVYNKKDIEEHHEMRIFAKKLRYTMEAFADLYPNKLKKEIGVVKKMQDFLGNMHDYDVWMDYIPGFVAENEVDLNGFMKEIKSRRKDQYEKFRDFYDKKKSSGFFEHLKEVISYSS